jgi:ATP-dependent protease ClpP protease subunit/exonuclease VII small subunit
MKKNLKQRKMMYDIIIDEEISVWRYSAKKHRDNLAKLNGNIKIFMSSYGGDVYEAIDIYNMNREYSNSKGQVEIVVGSKAMSAGAIITMSADVKKAHVNSTFMIHRAWTFTWGNAVELEQESKILNAIDVIQAKAFAKAMGKTEDEVLALLTNDTYYTGEDELKSTNIFDEIIGSDEVIVSLRNNISTYASAKKAFMAKVEQEEYVPNLTSAKKAIMECNDGKCPSENSGVNHSSLQASAQIKNSTEGISMEYTEKAYKALESSHAEALEGVNAKLNTATTSLKKVEADLEASNEKLATAEAIVAKTTAKNEATPEIMAMAFDRSVDKATLTAMAKADTLDGAKIALADSMGSDGAFGAQDDSQTNATSANSGWGQILGKKEK